MLANDANDALLPIESTEFRDQTESRELSERIDHTRTRVAVSTDVVGGVAGEGHTCRIEHMFDSDRLPVLDAGVVEGWIERLAGSDGPDDDGERVAALAALDRLACAAAGLQAEITARLDASVRRAEVDQGVPTKRRGRGVAAEVALARRESHSRGQKHVGLAKVLVDEMPRTHRAFRDGRITEWKATILARETACLSLADRQEVDRRLAADAGRLEKRGERELEGAVKSLAAELDAAAYVLRRRVAESQRRVTLRPVPDTMTRLSAELPVATGVAVFKSLSDAADSARAEGDPRARHQVMADTLVERLLGQSDGVVPVEIELVVSDEVLLGSSEGSAYVDGFGAIPAEVAREIAKRAGDRGLAKVRRLYRSPRTGQLVAMDSRSRRFRGGLARFIRLRDRVCRTPWCDAPVRHIDHPQSSATGGPTRLDNGQGLCEACNYAKESPGWSSSTVDSEPHTIEIRTPSGRTYRSTAPPRPGHVPRPDSMPGLVPRIDLAFTYGAA